MTTASLWTSTAAPRVKALHSAAADGRAALRGASRPPQRQPCPKDYPFRAASARHGARIAAAAASAVSADHIAAWVTHSNTQRLQALEEQAMTVLTTAAENFQHPVFPCALIAGDVVILHLLHRLGLLPPVQVAFIDTYHLFPETHAFLRRLEDDLGFKAHVFHADGFASKEEFVEKHGSDLFLTDIEEYDRICKVEPFGRALRTLQADVMINGRRRDHGFERAFLDVFEAGTPANCQPLAHWTFADCFFYLKAHNVPAHPLHAQGYPSLGDVHSTVTVPREQWFEYGGERAGRFQGLTNPDGSLKTECGIHNRPT